MTPKIIMVPFSGKDSELGALETAAELARKWNAHLEVWHVAPNPYSTAVAVYSVYGMGLTYIPDALLVEIEKKSKANIIKAQKKYHQFLRIMQIPETDSRKFSSDQPSASFHLANGRADLILRMHARLTDLVIISRGYIEETVISDNLVTDIALHSGKPVMLVPSGKHAKPLGDKVMIAWNGSLQATRAVSASMPFLNSGKVLIVSALERLVKKFPLSAFELENYLCRHGIEAKTDTSKIKGEDVESALLTKAKKFNAGLIVMGAYTHTRAREVLLGGVTKYMLKEAKIPLLLTH